MLSLHVLRIFAMTMNCHVIAGTFDASQVLGGGSF
jgi:hypothetical protein